MAEVRLKGRDGIVPMTHWVTEVFRRTASGWMLVHRHADSTVERYARLTTPL